MGKQFKMPIDDVFFITGRGVVATGRVEKGNIHVGDEVVIIGKGKTIESIVTGVEMFRKLLDQAEEGDNCGILLHGVTKKQLQPGMVMTNKETEPSPATKTITKSPNSNDSPMGSTLSNPNNHIHLNMAIDKKKIEYVIGIDLGHGETSAAICPMQWDKPISQISLQDDKDIELGGNQKVIPSVIAFKINGAVLLGENAVESENVEKIYVGFKKRPKDINREAEKIMIAFMKNVYLLIRNKLGAGELTNSNHLVYIACPSGWDKSSQNLYFQMAQKADIPVGGIIPESRGAFIKALEEPQNTIKRNMEKGAVVVDVGSSTLDFTYLSHSGDKWYHCDFGYDCGASKVEIILMQSYEETEDCLQRFREEYPDRIDRLTYEFRKHKEGIFNKTGENYFKKIDLEEICGEEEYGKIKIRHTEESLTSLLIKKGYVDEIRRAMIDFKNKYLSDKPINGVLLTGGASRMNIIKNLVIECWGVPENKISRDSDPSLTISRGVAIAARKDLRTSNETTELEPLFRSISGSRVYSTFVDLYGNHLYEEILECVKEQFIDWRDCDHDVNMNTLNSWIENGVEEIVSESAESVSTFLLKAIEHETLDLRNKVDAIVQAYTTQGVNVEVPRLDALDVMDNGELVDLNSTIEELSKSIEIEESINWGGMIAGAGVGVAIGMLLGGPITWLIGGLAYLGSKFGSSQTEEEKRKLALSKNLDGKKRIEIFHSVQDKWDDIEESIHDSIFDSLQSNHDAQHDVISAVDRLMKAYKDALSKSRIMVD